MLTSSNIKEIRYWWENRKFKKQLIFLMKMGGNFLEGRLEKNKREEYFTFFR